MPPLPRLASQVRPRVLPFRAACRSQPELAGIPAVAWLGWWRLSPAPTLSWRGNCSPEEGTVAELGLGPTTRVTHSGLTPSPLAASAVLLSIPIDKKWLPP